MMAETGFVVKSETSVSPGDPMSVRAECPDCKALREQLAEAEKQFKAMDARRTHWQRKAEAAERQLVEARADLATLDNSAEASVGHLQGLRDAALIRAEAAEALAGAALAALRDLRTQYLREAAAASRLPNALTDGEILAADEVLATDAARQTLARWGKEQAVIHDAEAVRDWMQRHLRERGPLDRNLEMRAAAWTWVDNLTTDLAALAVEEQEPNRVSAEPAAGGGRAYGLAGVR